jgi:hypothetical protein
MTKLTVQSFVVCLRRALATCGVICILSFVLSCRHQAAISTTPQTAPPPSGTASMQPDQVNIAGWDKAWTNLLNNAEQSFTPSLPRLIAVEVELVVGNPGATEDELTLVVLDSSGRTLAGVTRWVPAANPDQVVFVISKDGIEVSSGQTYWLKLSGGATFGWKYVVNGYEKGEATFNGKPLLPDARSTFLFRSFGAK